MDRSLNTTTSRGFRAVLILLAATVYAVNAKPYNEQIPDDYVTAKCQVAECSMMQWDDYQDLINCYGFLYYYNAAAETEEDRHMWWCEKHREDYSDAIQKMITDKASKHDKTYKTQAGTLAEDEAVKRETFDIHYPTDEAKVMATIESYKNDFPTHNHVTVKRLRKYGCGEILNKETQFHRGFYIDLVPSNVTSKIIKREFPRQKLPKVVPQMSHSSRARRRRRKRRMVRNSAKFHLGATSLQGEQIVQKVLDQRAANALKRSIVHG